MDIYETIEKRRSVRSYREEEPVYEDILKKILEAGKMAPSANNTQEYKFVVVKNAQIRKALANAASQQRFIAQAPVVIVGVSLNPEAVASSGVPNYAIDLALAIDHITLAATEEGLGTCWITSFSQEDVKEILNIPKKYKVLALLPLGVAYDDPGVKSRKKLKDLICKEEFSE